MQSIPSLVSAYIFMHTITLLFVNVAVATVIFPCDLPFLNPVISSWQVDEALLCRDIDASLGWDENWLQECSRGFGIVRVFVACVGLFLMIAQWWALLSVRRFREELRLQQRRTACDIENMGTHCGNAWILDEKSAGKE